MIREPCIFLTRHLRVQRLSLNHLWRCLSTVPNPLLRTTMLRLLNHRQIVNLIRLYSTQVEMIKATSSFLESESFLPQCQRRLRQRLLVTRFNLINFVREINTRRTEGSYCFLSMYCVGIEKKNLQQYFIQTRTSKTETQLVSSKYRWLPPE